jgi:hypothetical protein
MTNIFAFSSDQFAAQPARLSKKVDRLAGSNRLAVLAEKIRVAHGEAQAAWVTAIDRCREAGQGLIEAKELVPHGQWLSWLEGVGIPSRTAQNYMQLARLPEDKYATVAHLGLRRVLELIGRLGQIPELGEELVIIGGPAMSAAVLDPAAMRPQPQRYGPDFWPTPPSLIAALQNYVLPGLPEGVIWEPAAGDGRLVRAMSSAGRTVIGSDLYPRDGTDPYDFLTGEPPVADAIVVTNPPFNNSEEFLIRGLALLDAQQIGGLVLLLRHDHLMAAGKTAAFNKAVCEIHCNWRPLWIDGTAGNPCWSFHWVVWHAGPRQPPLYLTEADLVAARSVA